MLYEWGLGDRISCTDAEKKDCEGLIEDLIALAVKVHDQGLLSLVARSVSLSLARLLRGGAAKLLSGDFLDFLAALYKNKFFRHGRLSPGKRKASSVSIRIKSGNTRFFLFTILKNILFHIGRT